MECNRCLLTTDIADVSLNEKGSCNFCDLHDSLEKSSKDYDWNRRVKHISDNNNKYDCLIGISGGLDSSLLLEYTVKKWGLKPLCIHYDNGWNVPEAENNMRVMVDALGVDFITYKVNMKEYDKLCLSFLQASVSDADIPNDMAMGELMLRTCNQYGIKYIFNGHNFRTEGSTPLSWSYMDAEYIQSVYTRFTGKHLINYPLLTFWKQLYYTVIKGIRQERPFYYLDVDYEAEKKRLISQYGWRDYGGKHMENIYTAFIGAYYLPVKFGIDKRIVYDSALIRSGKLTKAEDKIRSDYFREDWIQLVCDRLGIHRSYLADQIMNAPKNSFKDFKTYHKMFKRYRWVFELMAVAHLVPKTFVVKYCR